MPENVVNIITDNAGSMGLSCEIQCRPFYKGVFKKLTEKVSTVKDALIEWATLDLTG